MKNFHGVKLALIIDNKLLAYERDNKLTIPFPGMWDLPGGGRENNESPAECALRELHEEFGLVITPSRLTWIRYYPFGKSGEESAVFMAGQLTTEDCAAITFGSEGQQWVLMLIDDFLAHQNAVPHLKDRLRDYLDQNPLDVVTRV